MDGKGEKGSILKVQYLTVAGRKKGSNVIK